MVRFRRFLILAPACLLFLLACDQHRPNPIRQTDFSDDGFGVKAEPPPEPFFEGERDYKRFTPYETPEIVRERQRSEKPAANEAEKSECVETEAFRIHEPNLVINVDTQTMDFKLRLESKVGTEVVHLRGAFDRSEAPWRSELYAVDQALLEKRRVSAVALCLTAHVCDVLGVNIYYVIDGKLSCRQLQSGVRGPRVAMSGDEEDVEPANPSTPVGAKPPVVPSTEDSKNQPHHQGHEQVEDEGEGEDSDADSEEGDVTSPPPKPPLKAEPVRPGQTKPSATTPATTRKTKKVAPRLEDLTPDQRKKATIEYQGPIEIAPPSKNPYRLEGLPEPVSQESKGVLSQAIGSHNNGYLRQGTYLPFEGPGFVRQSFLLNPNLTPAKDRNSSWGTLRTQEFIENLGQEFSKRAPGAKLMVTSVSQQTGALRPKTYKGSSHRTGLDIDIAYIPKSDKKGKSYYAVDRNGRVDSDLDVAKSWELAKSTLRVRREWMIVLFMDKAIKKAFCKHAKEAGEPIDDPNSLAYQTLRTITHWTGHRSHFHVRLYCPGNQGCQNTMVTLPNSNGCH
ncbi:MAG: penicillin-insensitive murein endopeptidase [Bdellovibrionales bacterium]